ncbi:hypothetical protein LPJ61_003004 [Coemansia biformis]|uniref:DUF4112 domain-containing protein n=1 Tax=Coemansia biformis TaxID=1286918 RepID=A0A9W7YDP8_9FUNG|nr:hypothetical protein LPJ61_003004 [Coemansia biformis]
MRFLRRQAADTPPAAAPAPTASEPPHAPADPPRAAHAAPAPAQTPPDGKSQAQAAYDHRDPLSISQKARDKKMKRLRLHAKFLDAALTVPCTCGRVRFGAESLVGLVPIVGDFAGVIMSLLFVSMICREFHTPATIKSQMMVNVAIDFVFGLVPVLGDIFDVLFKANMRNCQLIENHVDAMRSSAQGMEMGALDAGRSPKRPSAPAAAYLPKIPLRPDATGNAVRLARERMHRGH